MPELVTCNDCGEQYHNADKLKHEIICTKSQMKSSKVRAWHRSIQVEIPISTGQVWVHSEYGPLTVTFVDAHHETGRTLLGNVYRRGFAYRTEYIRKCLVLIYDPQIKPSPL